VRIIVAGPPKTGNVWIEKILSHLYELEILDPPPIPDLRLYDDGNFDALKSLVDSGVYKDNSIFHQHFWPDDELFRALKKISPHFVTIIRNPYDIFVSIYHYVQNFKEEFIKTQIPECLMINRPIYDERVLHYLEYYFGLNLVLGYAWLDSHQSLIVRYEDLHEKPIEAIRGLARDLGQVSDSAVARALEAARPGTMRKLSEDMSRHIRSATVGDWKNHLHEKHLEIFGRCHAAKIRRLGYDVVGVATAEPDGCASAGDWRLDRAAEMETEGGWGLNGWRREIVSEFQALIARQEATIEQLHGEIATRDREIEWLHRAVADRDRTVEWLHRAVADRDRTVEWLRGQAADRDSTIE
jgi:hypothetical protein